jgi:hypothetical protein
MLAGTLLTTYTLLGQPTHLPRECLIVPSVTCSLCALYLGMHCGQLQSFKEHLRTLLVFTDALSLCIAAYGFMAKGDEQLQQEYSGCQPLRSAADIQATGDAPSQPWKTTGSLKHCVLCSKITRSRCSCRGFVSQLCESAAGSASMLNLLTL